MGTYVKPADWNALVADPEVLLIDTRNDYEYGIGTFRGAVDPTPPLSGSSRVCAATSTRASKKIAMFCTGGIRAKAWRS